MIHPTLVEYLKTKGFGTISTTRPVAGGCISDGRIIQTSSGATFFLKTNEHAPADMFLREAEGLQALLAPPEMDGPKIPEVHLAGESFLLLEDLKPGLKVGGYWAILGRQMAGLHSRTNPRFGFFHDNYLGSTPQPNPWTEDGFEFFAEQRLVFQGELAGKNGHLSKTEVKKIIALADRLNHLIPKQPASLIHGDLWSGNLLADENGNPALIDPAAHFGWAEADLAMMVLFGSPPETFFQAYCEIRPLAPGYPDRFRLYNLYHLLNHLNLFGRGYYRQVVSVIEHYRS